MIPKLEELLKENTTLILWAWASKDYWFPLWEELKPLLLDKLIHFKSSWLSNDKWIDWWIDAINGMSELDTIDSIATKAPEDFFDQFRILVSIIICEFENNDFVANKDWWIEIFAEKYLNLLSTTYPDNGWIKLIAKKLNIVTLNYDRCFDKRFTWCINNWFQKILKKQREFQKVYWSNFPWNNNTIYHPHGTIWLVPWLNGNAHTYMNSNNNFGFDYGNIDQLKNSINRWKISFILPVDDLIDAVNPTYDMVNRILQSSKNVICIGVSEAWIKSSLLSLENVEQVYYSWSEKIATNFVPLSMRANEIVKLL